MSTNSYTSNISQALHTYSNADTYTVKINDTITSLQISMTSYENSKNIKYIKTGSQLTAITQRCFSDSTNLVSADLPNVKTIGAYGFTNCSNLKSINAPNLTTFTATYTLSGCTQLTSFYVNNATLKSIDNGHGIPNTAVVDSTGKQLKAVCPSITEFTNTNLTTLTATAFASSNISSIYIPNVKTFSAYTFKECNNLISCNFAQLTGTIGLSCFAGCGNLEYVKFNNLTALPGNAFTNCSKLKTIDFSERTLTSIPSVTTSTFTNDIGVKVIVPDSLYSTWSANANWGSIVNTGQIVIIKKSDYII